MTTWRAGQRITASGLQSISITDLATWTPTWTGQGSATFSTNTGYYYIVGDAVFVNLYTVCNVAGSGSTTLSVTMPTNIDRTNRQVLAVSCEAVKTGGATSTSRGGELVCFTSGTGAVADRFRVGDDDGGASNLVGSDITSTTIFVVQGWYRKA